MPGNFKQFDLRIIKTNKALLEALPKLLGKRNFSRITVNDICEESQISRTAFYSHFNDKYDLLSCWLTGVIPDITPIRNDFGKIENAFNSVIDNNKNVVINLLQDANNETLELINRFVSSLLHKFLGSSQTETGEAFATVLHSFCAGGIVNFMLWQIKNKFPPDLKTVNIHLYEIINVLSQLENNK